jgi:hypothetical protein
MTTTLAFGARTWMAATMASTAVHHTMAVGSCAIYSAAYTVATRVGPSTQLAAELGGVLVWMENCDRVEAGSRWPRRPSVAVL